MAQRTRWQYCQIETRTNDTGVLKQFFAERSPVETELHQNWPAMLAKLGEQGWEMIGVVAHEGGLGRRPLTYVLRRPVGAASGGAGPTPLEAPAPPSDIPAPPSTPPQEPPEPSEPKSPTTGFEPLRGT